MDIKEEPKNENDEADFNDALITLASAALTRDLIPLVKKEVVESTPTTTVESVEPPWYDVGIIKGTSYIVDSFYSTDSTNEHLSTSTENLPDYSNSSKVELCPGTAYKFRIAAINSFGRGEWSDISAFKTCLPGFPRAPCSIRISKLADGARLQWEPPTPNFGKILEYSVCLAVKTTDSSENISLKDLPFVRVYCGNQSQAFVDNTSLKAAYVDHTTKPAIIFRIAARNEKGYGPATQVRWLQDQTSVKGDHKKSKTSKLRI